MATLLRHVAENTPAGQPIGAPVTATDADGDALTYALTGPDASAFALNETSGQIQTHTALDYETRPSYSVIVAVRDAHGGSARLPVTIAVTDVDEPPDAPDAPTVTGATSTSLLVVWQAPANAGRPPIRDYDLQYRVAGSGPFTNVDFDGTATTTTLSGLTPNTAYEVQVRARNHEGTSPWSLSGTGRTNANTNPTFAETPDSEKSDGEGFGEDDHAQRHVAENTPAGQPIGAPVTATDADGDALTYALTGPDASAFALNETSGQIQTHTALDYETRPSYSVIVAVRDAHGGSAHLPVTIAVTDVAEPPDAPDAPTVTGATTTSLTVTWQAPANAGRPPLSDYDLQYRVAGRSPFTDANYDGTGTTATLDGLTPATDYEVQVRAHNDEGTSLWSLSGTGRTNANTNPTFTETPGEDGRLRRSVAENTPAGVNIGAPVTATDADGDALTYTLTGPDASAFALNETSGQLQTHTALNYEAKARYTVTVAVSDAHGGRTSLPVTILVTDVDEPPDAPDAPTVTGATSTSLTVVWQAPANAGRPPLSDYDLQYRVAGRGPFTNADYDGTGTTATLSGLTPNTAYQVQVRASNHEGTSPWSLSGTGRTNANTNPTVAETPGEDGRLLRRVAENTPTGQPIGAPVTATDADGDALTYALIGPDASAFALDETNGQIQTHAALDYEAKSSYRVTVSVTDAHGGSARLPVTIAVTDVDEPPDAPDAPTVTGATLTSLTVRWQAPANAGRPPISDYDLQYRAAGSEAAFTDADFDGTGTTATLSGLTPATTCEMQVRVHNHEGTSPWSLSGMGTTLEPSRDATLSSLEVAPGFLAPAFTPDVTDYTVTLNNSVPSFTATPTITHAEAELAYRYRPAGASDAPSEPGLSGAARSFELAAGANRLAITVTAQDQTTTEDYTVVVTRQANQPPQAPNLTDQQAIAGTPFNYQVAAFTNPDAAQTGQTLHYQAALADGDALPTWLTFTPATRTFSGTPPAAGLLRIEVTATDDGVPPLSAAASFTLTATQAAPVAVDDEATVAEGSTVRLAVLANDSDFENDALTVEIVEQPRHGTATPNADGTITYVHDGSETTQDQFQYRVNDGSADSEVATVTITLTEVNDAPAFDESGYIFELAENQDGSRTPIYVGVVHATDPEGETVTYALTNGDATRFAIDPARGQITYTGQGEDAETLDHYRLTVTASDSGGTRTSSPVTVQIGDANDPGEIALSSSNPLVGHPVTATLTDQDQGVKDERWQWHHSTDGVAWDDIPGANSGQYTPKATDVEQLLCVTVTYRDAHAESEVATSKATSEATSEATEAVRFDPVDRAQTLRFTLAAVGRTIAENAVDALGERGATSTEGSHVTLGGHRVKIGAGHAAEATAVDALAGFLASSTSGGRAQGLESGPLQNRAESAPRNLNFHRPSMRQLLSRSSFQLALGEEDRQDQGLWTLGGRADLSGFAGQPDGRFKMDGNVSSGYLSLDYRRTAGAPTLGLAVSHSQSEVNYASALSGRGAMETTLTIAHPYGRWSPRAGMELWSLLGYGRGQAELINASRIDLATDLQLWLAAVGARNELLSLHGVDLAAKTDAFAVQITPDEVPELPAGEAVQRLRLALEGRTVWAVTPEGQLRPTLELGLRWDEGDAETGPGAEVAGGATYANARHGLNVEARGHRLLVHRDEDFEEWGASLTFRLAPGASRRLKPVAGPGMGCPVVEPDRRPVAGRPAVADEPVEPRLDRLVDAGPHEPDLQLWLGDLGWPADALCGSGHWPLAPPAPRYAAGLCG